MENQTNVMEAGLITQKKYVHIDVIAENKSGGGIQYSLDIKTSGHGKGNKINLPSNFNYSIIFKLHDDTEPKVGVRFDASAPIFAKEGGLPCPTDISTPQIMVDSCNADTLVVTDWNYGESVELYYQLNFVNEEGQKQDPYDPPITNGGGGNPPLISR